jgi:hypothetical protein
MSNRHQRRADLAAFRKDASRQLLTFLVEPADRRLRTAPLLQQTASRWVDAVETRVRHCIVCSAWITSKHDIGAVLLATAITRNPSSVGCCGVCRECWHADLPPCALDRACEVALAEAIPNGRLKPLAARR